MNESAAEKYEVLKLIGRGNFGSVHLVRHIDDERLYVMKKINMTDMSPSEKEGSVQEVQLLKSLRHPCIVSYKDSFVYQDILCLVMHYCEGGDLASTIREADGVHFDEDTILDWFVQIALGLQHCHRRRIVHRDLKTQNIFLTKGNQVKLGDFGIARVLAGTNELAMSVVGTPYSMSPEVCENKPYGFASDIWSLGCVLYELCMLKHAFDANNLLGLVWKIVQETFPPIPDIYSEDLTQLIHSMLDKNPQKRPTIHEVLDIPILKKRIVALSQSSSGTFNKRSSTESIPNFAPSSSQTDLAASSRQRYVDDEDDDDLVSEEEFLSSEEEEPLERTQRRQHGFDKSLPANSSFHDVRAEQQKQRGSQREQQRLPIRVPVHPPASDPNASGLSSSPSQQGWARPHPPARPLTAVHRHQEEVLGETVKMSPRDRMLLKRKQEKDRAIQKRHEELAAALQENQQASQQARRMKYKEFHQSGIDGRPRTSPAQPAVRQQQVPVSSQHGRPIPQHQVHGHSQGHGHGYGHGSHGHGSNNPASPSPASPMIAVHSPPDHADAQFYNSNPHHSRPNSGRRFVDDRDRGDYDRDHDRDYRDRDHYSPRSDRSVSSPNHGYPNSSSNSPRAPQGKHASSSYGHGSGSQYVHGHSKAHHHTGYDESKEIPIRQSPRVHGSGNNSHLREQFVRRGSGSSARSAPSYGDRQYSVDSNYGYGDSDEDDYSTDDFEEYRSSDDDVEEDMWLARAASHSLLHPQRAGRYPNESQSDHHHQSSAAHRRIASAGPARDRDHPSAHGKGATSHYGAHSHRPSTVHNGNGNGSHASRTSALSKYASSAHSASPAYNVFSKQPSFEHHHQRAPVNNFFSPAPKSHGDRECMPLRNREKVIRTAVLKKMSRDQFDIAYRYFEDKTDDPETPRNPMKDLSHLLGPVDDWKAIFQIEQLVYLDRIESGKK